MTAETILAILRIQLPDNSERRVEITKPSFTIGRIDENDLQLAGTQVSRKHARLLFREGHIDLIDLKSRNGTKVGDTKLTPNEPFPLAYGQSFVISTYTMRLEPVPQASVSPAPPTVVRRRAGPPQKPPTRPERSQTEPVMAVRPLSPPPAAPPPPAPPDDIPPASDDAFGLDGYQSRYLQYLPPIYGEHPFLSDFLLAFEGVLAPVEQIVDHFDLYLDPRTAPSFFLEQLARWLALTLDEKWPLAKRRAVLAEAAELYHRRGTRWSLSRYLEIYTGATPQIVEPEDQPHLFSVVLRVPAHQSVDRATVERIIEASKPAHTRYTLEIFSSV